MSSPKKSSAAGALAFGHSRFSRTAAGALRAAAGPVPATTTRLAVNLFFTPFSTKLSTRRTVPPPWRTERRHTGSEGYIVRFQSAAMALASGSTPSETAAAHGYADQSQLSRAFRQLSSLTPPELARQAAILRRHAERQAVAGRLVVPEPPNAERKAPAS